MAGLILAFLFCFTMTYVVYILFSKALDKYYIGYTSDSIEARLRKHNANHKGFTGKNADWTIKHTQAFITKQEAMKREKQIKSWKSRVRMEQLVLNG